MGYDEMCFDWVETRKHENDDGTWQVCHPISSELEDEIFLTEKAIDNHLWPMALDDAIGEAVDHVMDSFDL